MSAADQIDVVLDCEFAHNVLSKRVADTPIIVAKLFDATFWVGP